MTAVHLTPLFKPVREKIPPVYEIHVFIAAFQSVFVCGINNFRTFIHILEIAMRFGSRHKHNRGILFHLAISFIKSLVRSRKIFGRRSVMIVIAHKHAAIDTAQVVDHIILRLAVT